jgi:hypothetical protein
MIKRLLLVLVFTLPFSFFAQEINRVKISGKLTAPQGEDVEGISIYNISSQKGTISSADGSFEIEAAINDRIRITAIQFRAFIIIIDEGVINTQSMKVYLNPAVNLLDEVIVRPYDLSGNIVVDVGSIKTANVGGKLDLSYETLEFEYEFSDDAYTSIRGNKAAEAFHNGQEQYGGNILGLVSLLFPKKKKSTRQINENKDLVAKSLRSRFTNAYIVEKFNIAPEKANDFIYFAEESGMPLNYLKPENEILLLDFMQKASEEYKLRSDKN